MTYRVLPLHLHSLAEDVRRFYTSQWGILGKRVLIEQPIEPNIGFVTTLHALSKDHHWICVEVAESAYTNSLDQFILECKNRILPVYLFVAAPSGVATASFQADLSKARRNGVGVLEVTNGSVVILAEAISLSLSGLREPEIRLFPLRCRQPLSTAVSTFKGGNPSKACGVVFDEIESLTRRIAAKAMKRSAWRKLGPGQAAPKLRPKDPWANVAKVLLDHLDAVKLGHPNLTEALLARILGVTAHRNESGHKLSSKSHLQRRDKELRTRFESACDLLLELVRAMR